MSLQVDSVSPLMIAASNKTTIATEDVMLYCPHFFIIGILTIPVSVIGTLGSLLTLYLIIRQNSQFHSSTNSLMVNLCVATFLLCGTSSFFDSYTMIMGSAGKAADDGALCIIFAFLHFLWLSVSAHSSCAIAIHRLIAVLKIEKKNSSQMSCKLIAVILISYTWLVPFLVLLFPLLKIGGRYGFNRVASRCSVVMVTNVPYEIVLKVMNSLIPLAIMIVCYIIIFIKIMKTRQRFNFEESAIRVQGAWAVGLLRFKAEIRLTYIAFLTCAWFSICYIPLSIHGLIATEVYQLQSPLAQALVLMTWIGCATTPILYTLLSTDMRTAIKREWLRLLRRHSNAVDVNILA